MSAVVQTLRQRLYNPPNAVADPGINLRNKFPAPPAFHGKPQVIHSHDFGPVEKILQRRRHDRWPGYSLRDLVSEPRPTFVPGITVSKIKRVVAAYYGVAVSDIISPRRQQSIVRRRHVAVYITKRMTSLSLPAIGRAFGNRDHTTILQAVRNVERRLECEPDLASQIETLLQMIGPDHG